MWTDMLFFFKYSLWKFKSCEVKYKNSNIFLLYVQTLKQPPLKTAFMRLGIFPINLGSFLFLFPRTLVKVTWARLCRVLSTARERWNVPRTPVMPQTLQWPWSCIREGSGVHFVAFRAITSCGSFSVKASRTFQWPSMASAAALDTTDTEHLHEHWRICVRTGLDLLCCAGCSVMSNPLQPRRL